LGNFHSGRHDALISADAFYRCKLRPYRGQIASATMLRFSVRKARHGSQLAGVTTLESWDLWNEDARPEVRR